MWKENCYQQGSGEECFSYIVVVIVVADNDNGEDDDYNVEIDDNDDGDDDDDDDDDDEEDNNGTVYGCLCKPWFAIFFNMPQFFCTCGNLPLT